ncbi:MAG: cobalamin-binding protein [Calditrichaeota bacterium]|nr:cobalamin-binding protein [Calditrichota bacterium]
MTSEEIHNRLSAAVVAMQRDEVERLSRQALELGFSPEAAIEHGLAEGMNEVGRLFEAQEYFVPEVLVCARAMAAGFDILKEKVTAGKLPNKGTVVIGVVQGDFHDIGKNIVRLLLESAGFKLVDLGKNVLTERFVEIIHSENADIAALSTLMTTTMDSMLETVRELRSTFPNLMIMVGGAPLSAQFAKSIDAHFYGENARAAVVGAHNLLGLPFEP